MQCDIAVDASLNANEVRAVTADRLPPRETPTIPELMAPGRPNKTGVTKSGFNQRAEARIIRHKRDPGPRKKNDGLGGGRWACQGGAPVCRCIGTERQKRDQWLETREQ